MSAELDAHRKKLQLVLLKKKKKAITVYTPSGTPGLSTNS